MIDCMGQQIHDFIVVAGHLLWSPAGVLFIGPVLLLAGLFNRP
jgi:hypothetical protein